MKPNIENELIREIGRLKDIIRDKDFAFAEMRNGHYAERKRYNDLIQNMRHAADKGKIDGESYNYVILNLQPK